jgi:hypothetical protein
MDYDKYPIENINARELNPWHFYYSYLFYFLLLILDVYLIKPHI